MSTDTITKTANTMTAAPTLPKRGKQKELALKIIKTPIPN